MLKELGLPDYPPLPAGTDLGKVEEIRRTVYVGNLEKDCDPDELLNFFNMCIGEVLSYHQIKITSSINIHTPLSLWINLLD